jgi:hypothetical protein
LLVLLEATAFRNMMDENSIILTRAYGKLRKERDRKYTVS